MKITVVGSGGREHALVRAFQKHGHQVTITPGRPGCIPGSVPLEGRSLLESCLSLDADLYVVGPEQPLVDGLADELRAEGKHVFGPGVDGAQLEGSKIWMKDLLQGVPTARYRSFTPGQEDAAENYIRNTSGPWVIKTDYLAGGKGVLVTNNLDDAIADARIKLSKGGIVIEEALEGPEFSMFFLTDGHQAVFCGSAQDYKYLEIDGVSHMTGGVGSYSPVGWHGQELIDQVATTIVEPTLAALRSRGIEYRGVLYVGGMLTPDGPKVLEYNIRFGDPEAQVVLPRIEGDLGQIMYEVASGELVSEVALNDTAAVCVVVCVQGYPSDPQTGDVIIINAEYDSWGYVLQAGTKRDKHENLVSAGGRALNAIGLCEWNPEYFTEEKLLEAARTRAYGLAARINFDGMVVPDYIAAEAVSA